MAIIFSPDNDELPRLLELHKSLVEIQSISRSEGNATRFLTNYLRDKGFTVETQHVRGEQENVFAYVPGSRECKVLITSHIDTVAPYFPYQRDGDKISGRGTVDAKGCVATQIMAVETLLYTHQIAKGDVAMLFVVSEEDSGDGMRAANGLGLSWDAVIFGEPTELKLANGHKGILSVRLQANGKAGHSGYPETGRNAINTLVKCIVALNAINFPADNALGESTINVGTIEGGVAVNIIPEKAGAKALIRVAAGEIHELEELVRSEMAAVSSDVDVTFGKGDKAQLLDHDIEGWLPLNLGASDGSLDSSHN